VQRADSLEERRMRGWCPAPRQEIPRRPGWFIERKLGEGGFGEVWVARHDRSRERRVFKFCFDAARLTSFKRELTLFKLLRDALGRREDIAGLLEVELDEPPFYLESEYVEGGNLRAWGEAEGRLAALTLPERLRLVAEIAKAVAAAHSVGIIHKDLKPSNVFMRKDAEGRWHPLLADFGIGAVADRSLLERRGITVAGFTQSLLEPGSSRTGTRMYQPPEANLARPATVQGDVYALGVLLYQMVIGDFDQPLGIGWERRLEAAHTPAAPGGAPVQSLDPTGELMFRLLRTDIGECVDGDPAARLATAAQLVERLHTIDQRVAAEIARRKAERAAIRMRRLRAALATAVAALVVVVGLGAFAVTQWQRAVASEQRAEENAQKARASAEAASLQSRLSLAMLNAVIFDIQDSLSNLPASSQGRQRLLSTALERLNLSGEFVKQSAVDRQTAVALLNEGDRVLQFVESPRAENAGRVAGPGAADLRGVLEFCRRFYMLSLEIFQALAKADPNDAEAKRYLAVSHSKLGDVHLQLGATDKALQAYQKGLKLSEALAKTDPNDAQAQSDLAFSSNALAWILATCWDDSVRDGKKAVELDTKACELTEWKDPNSFDTLAAAYAEAGQFPDAVKWQKKALEHPETFDASELPKPKESLKLYEAGKSYHEARPAPGPGPKDRPPSG
jgi:serine/threonine-protein kinase